MFNVAIIIERANVELGGAERSISELCAQFNQIGVRATILAAKGDSKSEHVKILCGDLPGKRTSLKTFENALREHFKDNHYDIVHSILPVDCCDVYQPRNGTYIESIIQMARCYANPVMRVFKRLTHFTNIRRMEFLNAEKRLCRNPKITVAAISNYVRSQFKNHYALPDNRLAMIANGVNVNKPFEPKQSEQLRRQILEKVGMNPDENPAIFLFASYNFERKGLRSLMHALAQMNDQPRKAILAIAGKGKFKKYESLAKKLGISNKIAHMGILSPIQEAFAVCDAIVMPTYYDPNSRFILEALAFGKPVLTTRFDGSSECFEHKKHGFIVDDPANIQQITEGLVFLADPTNISAANQAIIDDNLKYKVSIERHCKELLELYKGLK